MTVPKTSVGQAIAHTKLLSTDCHKWDFCWQLIHEFLHVASS